MTKTATLGRTGRAFVASAILFLFASAMAPQRAPAQTTPAAPAPVAARVDSIDAWLGALSQAKRSTPQATLQQWITLQESLRDLAIIESDPATDSATAWRALYVAGYGFWTTELFDVAAATSREVAEGTRDRLQRVLALKDLAQSLENAGLFAESTAESERVLAASEAPDRTAINNHALRLLKAGRYEECLDYVRRIELTADVAHTRIFSARALAWRGRYPEAAGELRQACDSGETVACTMLERLKEEPPEKYWREDREYRLRLWQPYNRIDSASTLPDAPSRGPRARAVVSRFAPSYWFNEIHRLYPESGDEDIRARAPGGLAGARFGVLVVEGVPFVAFALGRGVSDSAARAATAAYLATLHGMSQSGSPVTERTRAHLLRLDAAAGGGTLVLVTHADWQEPWVRRLAPGAAWSVIEKP